jgi:hypothetical protein
MKKRFFFLVIILYIFSNNLFSDDNSSDLKKKVYLIPVYDMFLYGTVITQKNILYDKWILDSSNKNFVFVGFFGGALIPQKSGYIFKFGVATWLTPQWVNDDKRFVPENYGISFSTRFGYKHRFETDQEPINTTFDLSVLGGIKFTTDQIGFGSAPDLELLNIALWIQHGKFFFTTESVFIYTPFYSNENDINIWKIYVQSYMKTGYSVFNIEKFFRNIYGKMEINIMIDNKKYYLANESANSEETYSPSFELGWYVGVGCLEFGGGIGIDPENFIKNYISINKIFIGARIDIGDIKLSIPK